MGSRRQVEALPESNAEQKTPEQPAERLTALKRHEFSIRLHDLYTGMEKSLRELLYEMAEEMHLPHLKGPLFAMTHELAANGLKALYKRVYYKFFVEEIGLDYVSYEDWLNLFKTEIEAHQAENFARVCREQEMSVAITGRVVGSNFRIEVSNDGAPSDIELERLQMSINRAREQREGPPYVFMEDDEDDDRREGGGIGITMIVLSLRNLGIAPESYDVRVENDRTIARLDLPLSLLLSGTEAA